MIRPARAVFLATTMAVGALAARAALRGQLGLLLVGKLALSWFAVATTGVFFPHLEMYDRFVSQGPVGRKRIALTFDDGPDPRTTPRILATLASTRHRATFFVLGTKARRHPDVVRAIHAGGHTVGVHGESHDRLHAFRFPGKIRRELGRALGAVEAATGVRPRFFRPPLGHTSVTTVRGARRAGVTLVSWSLRAYDGVRGRSPDALVERVARELTDGAIVMLHDAAERDDYEPASLDALPRLLALLDQRGFTSVTLDTLLAAS